MKKLITATILISIVTQSSLAQLFEQDPGYLCHDGQWLPTVHRCNGFPDCAQGKNCYSEIRR